MAVSIEKMTKIIAQKKHKLTRQNNQYKLILNNGFIAYTADIVVVQLLLTCEK